RGRADPGAEWLRLAAVALGRQEGGARGIPLPRPQAHLRLVARTERHPRIHPSAARRVVERKDGAPVRTSRYLAFGRMGGQHQKEIVHSYATQNLEAPVEDRKSTRLNSSH